MPTDNVLVTKKKKKKKNPNVIRRNIRRCGYKVMTSTYARVLLTHAKNIKKIKTMTLHRFGYKVMKSTCTQTVYC